MRNYPTFLPRNVLIGARRNFPAGLHSSYASNDLNVIMVADYWDHHPAVGREEINERPHEVI